MSLSYPFLMSICIYDNWSVTNSMVLTKFSYEQYLPPPSDLTDHRGSENTQKGLNVHKVMKWGININIVIRFNANN